MSFLPGSHQEELYAHTNTFAENYLLSRGQEVNRYNDESVCRSTHLDYGQFPFTTFEPPMEVVQTYLKIAE